MPSVFPPNISNLPKSKILDFLQDKLLGENHQSLFLVTLNPEIALMGVRDKKYFEILSRSLAIVDGFGIKLLATLTGRAVGERIAGVELIEEVIKIAAIHELKVTVVVRKDGFSSEDEVEEVLRKKFFLKNYTVISCDQEKRACEVDPDTQLLIVGLGAPHQEEFIDSHFSELKELRLAVGSGGTFDFWTGKKKRAPIFLRKCGMEWFWRLIIQPNRARRIWNALVIFPYYAIKDSIK